MSKVFRAVATVASIASLIPGPHQPFAKAIAIAATIGAAVTAKKPVNQRQGLQLQFKIDPGAPIPWVVGRTAVGATVVHRETYGKDNHYYTWFAVLSGGGLSDGIEAMLADRVVVPYSGTSATGYFANWMWSQTQTGASPEASALGNGVVDPPYGYAGAIPGWDASSKLSSYSAISWTLLFDTKARRYQNGEPLPGWIERGARVYDPRQDSTYPGGSGPQRWADPSDRVAHAAARATWTFSETPALVSLMWKLGVWIRDESNPTSNYVRILGIGAPIALVDVAAHVASANVQEANGWKVGGELNSAMGKFDACKLIEEAGGARPIPNGALLSTLQKGPRVSLATITPDDLAGDLVRIPANRSRRERLNGARGRFRSEAHGWEMVPVDIVQVPDYVIADGREKTGGRDFPYVQDANQLACLLAYEVFDSRELAGIAVTVKPDWAGYKLGAALTLALPDYGFPSQKVIVTDRSIDPITANVTFVLTTETDEKHPAALGRTAVVPPTPTLTYLTGEVATPLEEAWTLEGTSFSGAGVTTPQLVLSGAVDNTQADAVIFDFRPYASGLDDDEGWSASSFEAATTTRKEFGPVTPATEYQASVRYRVRGVVSDRLILGPETTGAFSVPIPSTTRSQTIKITGIVQQMSPILLSAGASLSVSGEVGVQATGTGNARLNLRAGFDDDALTTFDFGATEFVAPGEPALVTASGSITNTSGVAKFVTIGMSVTGVTGLSVRSDTTNFLTAN